MTVLLQLSNLQLACVNLTRKMLKGTVRHCPKFSALHLDFYFIARCTLCETAFALPLIMHS